MLLKSSEITRRFERLSITGQVPTNTEWEQMEKTLYEVYPCFRDFMQAHRLLMTSKEHRTCLLVCMGFRPSTISHLLGTSKAYISKIRSGMMRKLFGTTGSPGEFDKLIQEMAYEPS